MFDPDGNKQPRTYSGAVQRGKVHTLKLATQERDFTGLCYGKITPTDQDCYLDFGNRLFVFTDAKLTGIAMERGQELAFEREVDGLDTCEHPAIYLIGEHQNREGAIDFANLMVVNYYFHKKWRLPEKQITVRAAIDAMLRHCKLGHYLKDGQP